MVRPDSSMLAEWRHLALEAALAGRYGCGVVCTVRQALHYACWQCLSALLGVKGLKGDAFPKLCQADCLDAGDGTSFVFFGHGAGYAYCADDLARLVVYQYATGKWDELAA